MQRVASKRGAMYRLGSCSQRCQNAHRKAECYHRLIAEPCPSSDVSVKHLRAGRKGPQGVQTKATAHESATGNGAQAKRRAVARPIDSENSSSVRPHQESATQDTETKVKVSDKLKAAVKQVDKSAYEVTALPMHLHQDVSLAPHRQEHPGQLQVSSASQLLPNGLLV